MNPLVHYVEYGAAEGRDPGPAFQASSYVAEYPEAAFGGQNPLAHHLRQLRRRSGAGLGLPARAEPGPFDQWRSEKADQLRRARRGGRTQQCPGPTLWFL